MMAEHRVLPAFHLHEPDLRVLRECGAKIVAVDLFNEVKAWAAENVATF